METELLKRTLAFRDLSDSPDGDAEEVDLADEELDENDDDVDGDGTSDTDADDKEDEKEPTEE